MEVEKGTRLLYLYQELTRGKGIQKQEAALRFHVNERSIQRDIEDLRSFLAEQNPPMEVCYVAKEKCYHLVAKEHRCLDCGEILAVCKILLESRSLKKSEMDVILDKLLAVCVSPEDKQAVSRVISNERLYYIEPHHRKLLTDQLWMLGQAIQTQSVLRVLYRNQTGQEKERLQDLIDRTA